MKRITTILVLANHDRRQFRKDVDTLRRGSGLRVLPYHVGEIPSVHRYDNSMLTGRYKESWCPFTEKENTHVEMVINGCTLWVKDSCIIDVVTYKDVIYEGGKPIE